MIPVKTPACNFTYLPPEGIPPEDCGELPCILDTEKRLIQSFWQPDEAERKAIASGALIALTTYGSRHPMVAITVDQTPQ